MNAKQLKDLNSTDTIEENFIIIMANYMDTIIDQASKYDNKEMYEKYINQISDKLSKLCKLSVEKNDIIRVPIQNVKKKLRKKTKKERYKKMGY